MNVLSAVEVVSFASKFSRTTGRLTAFLKSSKPGGSAFDTSAVVSGMFAEPLLVSKWLNDHMFIQHPVLRKKLEALIVEKQNLVKAKKYDDCSSDEKDLIIRLNAFHIYEGESHITVTDFMATALHNLKKFGLLDYGVADLATPPKAPHQSCYFVQVLV